MRLRFALTVVALLLLCPPPINTAAAASGDLQGWGAIHFGMTMEQVIKASGGLATKRREFSETLLEWNTDVSGYRAIVKVYFTSESVSEVALLFDDIPNDMCVNRVEKITAQIVKKYGKPDDHNGMNLYFVFPNNRKITLTVDFKEKYHRSFCSLSVDYWNAKSRNAKSQHGF